MLKNTNASVAMNSVVLLVTVPVQTTAPLANTSKTAHSAFQRAPQTNTKKMVNANTATPTASAVAPAPRTTLDLEAAIPATRLL